MVIEDDVVVGFHVQLNIYTRWKKKLVKFNIRHPFCHLEVLFYKDNYALILNIRNGVNNLAASFVRDFFY